MPDDINIYFNWSTTPSEMKSSGHITLLKPVYSFTGFGDLMYDEHVLDANRPQPPKL
jgi:hypothetical protein